MEKYTNLIFIIFLCILPLVIGSIVILSIRGVQRVSMRGIQSAIKMDNRIFFKTNEGNITIKRPTLQIWLAVIFLGAFELRLLALVVPDIIDIIKGKDESINNMSVIILTVIFLGYVLFQSIQSLRQPSTIQIDANSRTIMIRNGLTKEQILFSQLSEIFGVTQSAPRVGLLAVERINIRIMLVNGKVIEMGSVSGDTYNAHSRAVAIAQQIAEVTGAAIREPSKQ